MDWFAVTFLINNGDSESNHWVGLCRLNEHSTLDGAVGMKSEMIYFKNKLPASNNWGYYCLINH